MKSELYVPGIWMNIPWDTSGENTVLSLASLFDNVKYQPVDHVIRLAGDTLNVWLS